MSKENKKPKGYGGEKIDFKVAVAALKLYWDELVGKNKITAANCTQSVTFDLHHLKAYLEEAEVEFARMNVPYHNRHISVMPIAYSEKGRFSVLFTPSVLNAEKQYQNQFNTPAVKDKPIAGALALTANAEGSSNYDFQLNALNSGDDNP